MRGISNSCSSSRPARCASKSASPYHVVIPLSLLTAIAALVRAPPKLVMVGFLAILAAALCGAALGTYHSGVEWRWWPGPTDCSGPITDFRAKGPLLEQLQSVQRGALRRGGLAFSRPVARRLQRLDLARAGGARGLRPAGADAPVINDFLRGL